MTRFLLIVPFLLLPLVSTGETAAKAKTWEVPVAGNSYVTRGPGTGAVGNGKAGWNDPATVTSVYFRVDRAANLDIALSAKVPVGRSLVRVSVNGRATECELKGDGISSIPIPGLAVKQAGYVKLDLQGLSKTGDVFAEIDSVRVTASGDGELSYVKENEDNHFYWGRRGPSVHLGYPLPEGIPIEWFYNEVTVPAGSDPVGSYFMANGFSEGYFGMQVNSAKERRLLFSVWSPFKTDKPGEIPDGHRIVLLKKGADVHAGEFGGEGAGGQSYWVYPWKAGSTYRFLNRAHPDGKGSTIYSAWFYVPEEKAWRLIASFKRPLAEKYLTGVHSFLENFQPDQGYLSRGALYGNQWACDANGEWHELTEAKFNGDDIAKRRYRMDYAGGTKEGKFFLRNGGFFSENVKLESVFVRDATPLKKPVIDFKRLDGFDVSEAGS